MKRYGLPVAILIALSGLVATLFRPPASTGARQRAPEPERVSQPSGPLELFVRFDITDAGIEFRYFNSPDPSTPGERMFEFTGGGVGAIDYDADGRPDLYFTQGCAWPPDPNQRTYLDRLFRNVGARFVDATGAAGLVEPGFSQGLACGDFDGDGLQDIYVADIGTNRLFWNNGDGTYYDATAGSGAMEGALADAWTVSAAMADVNRDGLPDLFDVNYLRGEQIYELICNHDGKQRVCSPETFEGQPDRLLLSRGDGTFIDVTKIAGIDAPDGTGLGVVAADFDGSGRLSLFVANDIQANHFYANETPSPGGAPRFEERALVNGLAYDREGRPQACMGVAVGDANGDGRLDLFVTNYVDESNTLYLQTADGAFTDESRAAGLTEPSFAMLGFGTQFLDADLDGWEDLVVTNGHIDDFLYRGYEYRMRPQFFRNLGGRFEELPAKTAGPFFGEKRLGRGLARLDWNGDGRDELVVSHLEDPAVLLTNVSERTGGFIAFRFAATGSARDAIGATVTVVAGGRRLVRQLTAGDGYAASNERKLMFGLAEGRQAESVSVRWPSGREETFQSLPAGTEWLLIEGRGHPLRLTPRQVESKAVAAGAGTTEPADVGSSAAARPGLETAGASPLH